jgi:hypothetical protein
MNKANFVDHDYHRTATMWLSQYVHTFPMSVHQMLNFRAGTLEARHMSAMPIQYSCGFLASAITKMAKIFPTANIDIRDADEGIFSRWCAVVEQGVTN